MTTRSPWLRKRLYRSRHGVLTGVCRGLAESFGLSVFWLRAAVLLALLVTGAWPVLGLYVIASLVMPPAPVKPLANAEEEEFYDTYVNSRRRAVERLMRRYTHLDRRIRRMEDAVTSREFHWDRKLHRHPGP
jgi:phage shock protein C